jgi:hypothetical protein
VGGRDATIKPFVRPVDLPDANCATAFVRSGLSTDAANGSSRRSPGKAMSCDQLDHGIRLSKGVKTS